MKLIRVGDPHVTVSNLEDSGKLVDFICKVGKERGITIVEFLGDQLHTHAVIRTEALDFWDKSLEKLNKTFDSIIMLVGNHDQVGSKEKEHLHSLNTLRHVKNVTIIDSPTDMLGLAYIPYMSDKDAFLKAANDLYKAGHENTLIAHQTFTGASYDNGFYAEDGIDPALVPQKSIISGHIHTQQTIGKCFYPGTAKWDSVTDANQDKGIWIFEYNDGVELSREFISTKGVVSSIHKYVIKEGDPELDIDTSNNNKVYIELHGQTAWITKIKNKYKGLAKIKAVPSDKKTAKVDTSKVNIFEYLEKHFQSDITVSKQDIYNHLKLIFGEEANV